MSLVGDIIMELRSRIPDAPPVGNVPQIILTPYNDPSGFLPTGLTYFVVGTQFNQWGESAPSAEASVALTAPNNAIRVDFYNVGNSLRLYWGNISGEEVNVGQAPPGTPPAPGTGTLVMGIPGYVGYQGMPPTRSTLFLPDGDGNFIGGYTAFRLLNRALQEMVKIAGGIIDVTGVNTTVNTSM